MCVRLQTFGTCTRKALKAARMLKLGAYSDDGEEEPDHDTGSECGECKHVTSEKARTSVQTRSFPSGSAGWRRVGARKAVLKATEQPIDTGTAAGKCFLDMLGVFAEGAGHATGRHSQGAQDWPGRGRTFLTYRR